MLKITKDPSATMSYELTSLGAEAIIGISSMTGTFTGVVYPDAKITASSVALCKKLTKLDTGKYISNAQYYDDDVTNRKYAQFHYEKQHMSLVIQGKTLTVYSNLGKKHIFMFFPFDVSPDDENKYVERIHQCMMSYRTENNLKNMHFCYKFATNGKRRCVTTNLFRILAEEETSKIKKSIPKAKTVKIKL